MNDDLESNSKEVDKENITLPFENNEKLGKVLDLVNSNKELKTLWKMQNMNSAHRLGMSDHSIVHVEIVSNTALKMTRLFFKSDIQTNLLTDFDGFSKKDVEVVTVISSLFHDLGMSIQRKNHEELSLLVAQRLIDDILEEIYNITDRTILRSEIMHAIFSHRSGGSPKTIEAGIVRVSDALDMEKGRSRLSFKTGEIDIHAVSAAAIEKVNIKEGEDRPIDIKIEMNNSSGIFQIDELLKKKLEDSGIAKYVEIEALIESEVEKKLIHKFKL